ncbi:S-layer homology domain-containing protein [Acetivibrio cellulolyticus]|uniref:S-layer homology domain-containing protein n=1 Tax=Acetivibrio cellulolyticus TaxID=35830 RepID=UPI0001E2CC24|nr:S-layer homology domain-containing protein [Acetivibrio cellulolyticus]
MVNINKALVYIILISSVVLLNANFSFSHGLNYEIDQLGSNKERVMLKWSDPEEKMGFAITYHYFTNSKTLHIGYELKEGYPTTAYVDYDLNSVISPIRVNIHELGCPDYAPFSDIKGIEAEEYITHLHDAGIINGRPDGKFAPDSFISRAEFMVIMVKALGLEGKGENVKGFTDIDKHWAKEYILLASKNGLISGYEDKTVRPDKSITLAEVSSIISRSFTFKTTNNGIYSKIQQGKWYSNSIKKMFDVGILNSKDSIYKAFNEEKYINRANCAMMISRAISTY